MRNFLSRAEADEICDGLMERYHEEKGVSCVDIDGFVKDVLRCPVFYEAFAEKDLDKIGLSAGTGSPNSKSIGKESRFRWFSPGTPSCWNASFSGPRSKTAAALPWPMKRAMC